MCLRFVHRGNDVVTGFNFDIDLAVWDHRVFADKDRIYIGIKVGGVFHSFHGVNANGNAGTLLYVPECEEGKYRRSPKRYRIDMFSERFVKNQISFDEALQIAGEKEFVNVPNCSMQAMLSDKRGRTLIVEPGVGYKECDEGSFALVTNYSIIDPKRTEEFIIPGDDRYERAKAMLETTDNSFGVDGAFKVLNETRQEGLWATRVSFVYSANKNAVFYALNNEFDKIHEHKFI